MLGVFLFGKSLAMYPKKVMESGVALNNKCAKEGLIAEEGEAELTTALTFGGEQRGVNITEAQLLYYIVKYKPELVLQFAKAGLRVYLHGLVGFKYEVKAPVTSLRGKGLEAALRRSSPP